MSCPPMPAGVGVGAGAGAGAASTEPSCSWSCHASVGPKLRACVGMLLREDWDPDSLHHQMPVMHRIPVVCSSSSSRSRPSAHCKVT